MQIDWLPQGTSAAFYVPNTAPCWVTDRAGGSRTGLCFTLETGRPVLRLPIIQFENSTDQRVREDVEGAIGQLLAHVPAGTAGQVILAVRVSARIPDVPASIVEAGLGYIGFVDQWPSCPKPDPHADGRVPKTVPDHVVPGWLREVWEVVHVIGS